MCKNKDACESDDFKTVAEMEKCIWKYDDDYLKTAFYWACHPFAPSPQSLPVMKRCL